MASPCLSPVDLEPINLLMQSDTKFNQKHGVKKVIGMTLATCGWVMCLCGCSPKVMDPSQIGRFRPAPAVTVILDTLGVAQESPTAYEHAEEPRPSDLVAEMTAMPLGPGDIIRVDVYELYASNQMVSREFVVDESGEVSIPKVGVLQVANYTEQQVEQLIRNRLQPAVLKEPNVTVSLVNSQRRRFNVQGDGVTVPGPHAIPRYDFRLLDALALAGGVRQYNVSYIYVTRREAASPYTRMQGYSSPTMNYPITGTTTNRGWSKFMEKQPAAIPGSQSWPVVEQLATQADRERAMLGMVNNQSQHPWAGQNSQVIAATQFPDYPGYDQVVAPSEFDRIQEQIQQGGPIPQTGSNLGMGSYGSTHLQQQGTPDLEWIFRDGRWVPVPKGAPLMSGNSNQGYQPQSNTMTMDPLPQQGVTTQPQSPQRYRGDVGANQAQPEWVLRDGQWVPVQRNTPPVVQPQQTMTQMNQQRAIPMEPYAPQVGGQQWQEASSTRLIRIPADQLLAGVSRYNIVIKPGDSIMVPYDQLGYFYIMGNVSKSGQIGLSGEPITLMRAIAMAGGLGPLAYPKKVEVRRILDRNREEIVLVDLDKIASGEQPDFYIKPGDEINVGTHYTSRWRAVLRNAFRVAYGFSFVYDRNFADSSYETDWPSWF